ncbi:hypothetical protein FRC03_001091 [Tulasnella sp. 419]|nr:hypothetical protein FRC03_001091 [Tulasnella sp. 419]
MTAEPNLVPGNNGDEIQQQQPAVIPSSNYDTITSRHDIIMQMPEAPGGAINIEREHEISTPRRVAQPPSSPIRTTDQANPPPRYEELVT